MFKKLIQFCLMVGIVFISFICVGCEEKQEQVNVDFIVDGTTHSVQMAKGAVLTNEDVPIENQEELMYLYYDEEYKTRYSNEIINENVTIFVKKTSLTKLVEEAQNDFIEQYNKPLNIGFCYGEFDGAVVFFAWGIDVFKDEPNNGITAIPLYLYQIPIYGFKFTGNPDFSIILWKDGKFYDLANLMDYGIVVRSGILKYEDAEKMYEKHFSEDRWEKTW